MSKEKRKEYNKQYKLDHKKEIAEYNTEYMKQYRLDHPEYMKQYRLDHKEEIKQWELDHKDEINEKKKQRRKQRRLVDIIWKLRNNVSTAISNALNRSNGSKQGDSVMQYLPYTIEKLKAHLENLFEPWMTWENYGEWHIDHIEPQSKLPYDSMKHPNFLKCWALENLQPLEAIKNMKKGNKSVKK